MAENVAEECRQYVSKNANNVSTLTEIDAVEFLYKGFLDHSAALGWVGAEEDFQIPARALVREELRKYRDSQ